ncbi:MAG: CBS domain-containing protein [Nitrososphaeria archaeon]|nr:CBS domain-containing protein [Nitrosopumilaceae archaeon]NIP09126.1 CBS domain-containing protein [Nitrosopumilaceae archaeon]NIP91654.1 CBS domain-containing protein [Nitrososphaeria archaeon]NIS95494.1 CBS domain-containing protein [Nitrosopumilaceae archaeon]
MAHTFVKDVMITNIASLDSSSMIMDAAKLMEQKNIGCIIVTQQNLPIGILTERDFVRRIAAKEKPLTSTLEEVMSSPLISIGPEETVWEAAESMKVNNIHKLPVIEDSKVTGIITTTDLVEICSVGSDSEMRRICDQILMRMQKE